MARTVEPVLRAPREADRCDIQRVVESSGFFSAAEVQVALEVFDEALSAGSPYCYRVAELHGRVVGLVCWGGPIELTESSFDLYWIAVDAAQRGSGIGAVLIAAAERGAAGAGCTQLIVETSGRAQYAPTHAFYERRGYQRVAELPDFYAPGDAKVYYVKVLTPDLA
jgi:ribosomal protein S18 acetylase RimI-like enzyme